MIFEARMDALAVRPQSRSTVTGGSPSSSFAARLRGIGGPRSISCLCWGVLLASALLLPSATPLSAADRFRGSDDSMADDRSGASEEKDQQTLPPDLPVRVELSVDLLEISQIQDHDEKFSIEFYLYYSWYDPRLAFDAKEEGREKRQVPVDEIWTPEPELLDDLELEVRGGREAHVHADGKVLYHQFYRATIPTDFDLHEFPLDRHFLEMNIEAPDYETDEVVFVAGSHAIERQRRVPHGWTLCGTATEVGKTVYPVINESYSRLTFKVDVRRDPEFYFWAIVLPLVPIVVTSWSVFWMEPKEFGSQIGVGVTAMLTVVAYRITIDSSLPPLNYMTRMDFFLLVCQVFVFAAFLLSIVIHVCYSLETRDMVQLALVINQRCRWVFPLLMAGTCIPLTWCSPATMTYITIGMSIAVVLACRPTPLRLWRCAVAILSPESLVGTAPAAVERPAAHFATRGVKQRTE